MCIAMTQLLNARMVRQEIRHYCARYKMEDLDPDWSWTQAHYFIMGGYRYRSTHQNSCFHDEPKQLKIKHLKFIIREGLIGELKQDTEMIKQFSRSDRLAKTVALIQALWFFIQTFARYSEHLPASPLEVTAVAYISCTFFSFILWFAKPQNVGFATEVTDDKFERVIRDACNRRRRYHSRAHQSSSDVGRNFHHKHHDRSQKKIHGWKNQLPNMKRHYTTSDILIIGLTWCFTSCLFGGLHLLAWNYEFPSSGELTTWRYTSLSIIIIPPVFYIWFIFMRDPERINPLGLFLVVLYVGARTYNLLEVFFCFRSTPADLYKVVQWTEILPHF